MKVENGQVYIILMTRAGSEIEYSIGQEKKIKIEAPKVSITLSEQVAIAFTWQKFDLTTETWLDDTANTDSINLDINGTKETLQPVNGSDTLTFSSAEPGSYIMKTENPGVDNASLEVTVNNA